MPKEMIDALLNLSQNHPGRISLSLSLNTVDSHEYRKLMKLDLSRTIENLNYLESRSREFVGSGIASIDVTRISTDGPGDSKFIAFANSYLRQSNSPRPFFDFKLHNLNGWINHDVDVEFAVKNMDPALTFLYPCEEWKRVSILPNGEFSLCCMTHEASDPDLNFNNMTVQELYKHKLSRYVPIDQDKKAFLSRKFASSPCSECSYIKTWQVKQAQNLILSRGLKTNN